MGQWPLVLCRGSLVFGMSCVITGPCAVLPLSQFQSKAMELPHSAWVSEAGLVFKTGSGPSQECSAWVGWAEMFSAGMVSAGMVSSRLSGFTSGRSFADTGITGT